MSNGVQGTSLTAASTAGGDTIQFNGQFFGNDATNIRVYYAPLDANGQFMTAYQLECLEVTAVDTRIQCKTGPGVGKNLQFIVHRINPPPSQILRSNIGTDTYSYPSPTITPSTLRLSTTTERSEVTGTSSQGETLFFRGVNFGTVYTAAAIFYGPASNPLLYRCVIQTKLMTDNTAACTTTRGAGTNYQFTYISGYYNAVLQTHSWSTRGSDSFSYPFPPVIDSVTGCAYSNGAITMDCPTSALDGTGAEVYITLTGRYFGNSGAITRINGKISSSTTHVLGSEENKLRVLLVPGVGQPSLVDVQQGTIFSPSFPLLSYAAPVIDAIYGCGSMQGNFTINCARVGGTRITIIGNYFGDPLVGGGVATVVVGGNRCANVQHSTASPQTNVTCTLGSGTALLANVIVIQYEGALSSSQTAAVSYTQCEAGMYGSGLTCLPCLKGTYTREAGQLQCLACAAGTYNNKDKSTTCSLCDASTYQAYTGQTSCPACVAGKFSNVVQSVKCTDCFTGRYSSSNGTKTCSGISGVTCVCVLDVHAIA